MLDSLFDTDSEPIVSLEAVYGAKRSIVEKCIIIFSKAIYDQLHSEKQCEMIAEIGACGGNIPVWAFDNSGEKIAFYLSPIGSAIAGGTVPEVSHLTGASKFIMFGSCGSLDGEKTAGRFIIPTEAYRGEGLSYYFAKPQDYIAVKNADRLAAIFTELSVPFVTGRVWTTESILRETVNLVKRRKSEGCIAVEMELAGVQAVCDFYGFELYDFLAAGDVLSEDGYDVGDIAAANHSYDKLRIALKIAERV